MPHPAIWRAPIGTGPYKLEGWNRGSDLKLVANDAYWGGAPQIDEVTYRFVAETRHPAVGADGG